MKLTSTATAFILNFAAATFDTPEAQAIQDAFTRAKDTMWGEGELAAAGYSHSSYPSAGIWMQLETPSHMLTVLNEKGTADAIGAQGERMLARVYAK